MEKSPLSLPLFIALALVIGFGVGYFVFRNAPPPAPQSDLLNQINSLVNSKTPYVWQVQLRGTVKSWDEGTMELQAEGGTDTVQVVADPETQFVDSSGDPLNPTELKSFAPEDVAIGDELEMVVNFNEGALLRALVINKLTSGSQ